MEVRKGRETQNNVKGTGELRADVVEDVGKAVEVRAGNTGARVGKAIKGGDEGREGEGDEDDDIPDQPDDDGISSVAEISLAKSEISATRFKFSGFQIVTFTLAMSSY